REDDGVELLLELVAADGDADVDARLEGDALGRHLQHAAVDQVLLHLEVGNAVAQQSADAVVALEERHVVAGARELLRARHAGGPGADHGDLLAGLLFRQLGHDPAFLEGVVDDVLLDVLDRDRVVVDVEDAGFLARRRTDAAGEFGEVVRRVQALDRVLPAVPIDEVVPVGNDVPERATLVAEGNAAIHAARALDAELILRELLLELAPVLQTIGDRLLVRSLAIVL